MIDRQLPPLIVSKLLLPHDIESVDSIPQGMSGASVFRCRNRAGELFALRQWPSGTKRSRINEIQKVMDFARDHDCQLVPKVFASIAHHDRFWELSQWMPGSPLPLEAGSEQIRQGASMIAAFHRSVRDLGIIKQPPPAVAARIRRCRELDRELPKLLERPTSQAETPELTHAIEAAGRLLRSNWAGVSGRIARSMTRYQSEIVETQYVLRDVHRLHVLFHRGAVSGLIDFDAVRVDTPMTDLARWVGSFPQADQQGWETALAGYFEHSPSSVEGASFAQESLAKEICFATAWISLANWVIWIVAEGRSFPAGWRNVATRIGELVRLCEIGSLGDLRKH